MFLLKKTVRELISGILEPFEAELGGVHSFFALAWSELKFTCFFFFRNVKDDVN
jgi:hypothetical protein